MRNQLLPFLQCCDCKGDLYLEVTEKDLSFPDEIISGRLVCGNCNQSYPIIHGVPRFVGQSLSKDVAHTSRNFGQEWRIFHQQSRGQRQQLVDWLKPLPEDFLKGKIVVDLGCGMGRNPLYFAEQGAKMVIGVDISEAVDVAFQNCRPFHNIHLIQADIYRLPLKPLFDFAFSLGVLHHLPNPREGFNKLADLARPGASVYTWVYGRENNGWVVNIINPIRIHLTSKFNPFFLRILSSFLTLWLYLVLRLVYRPLHFLSKKLAKRLFYYDYLFYISAFTFREIELIVFDHLTAPTAFYIPREEIEGWFRQNSLTPYEIIWHNSNSWKGIGTKSSHAGEQSR